MIAPHHREQLEASAIDPGVAESWGVKSTEDGLVFPWRTAGADDPLFHQTRWDNPNGRGRYNWPAGQPPILNFPPGVGDDVTKPLILIEGTKQHIAVHSIIGEEHVVVGLAGCWGFSVDGKPIPELTRLSLVGREILVVFDGDIATNRDVHNAGTRLVDYVTAMGASTVKFVKVPGKLGIDDLLGSLPVEMRAETMTRLLSTATELRKQKPKQTQDGPLTIARKLHARQPIAVDLTSGDVHQYQPDLGVFERVNLDHIVAGLLRDDFTTGRARDVHALLMSEANKEGWALPDEPQHLVVVRNGALDPATGELVEHSPEHLATVRFDVDWQPNARADAIETYIERQAPDQLEILLDAMSPVLDIGGSPEQALLMVGAARTGKGTVSRLLERLVGEQYVSAVELKDLSNKFMGAELYGKLVNIGADLSTAYVTDLNVFKKLTGQDPIQAQRKYGQPFVLHNQALMVFTSNHVPVVGGAETASYIDRITLVLFTDPYVIDDGSVEEELQRQLPGFLRLLVEAYQERRRRGHRLPALPAVQIELETSSDRVALFLSETTRPLEDDEVAYRDGVTGPELHGAFKRWAADESVPVMGRNKFYGRVRSFGIDRDEGNERRWHLVLGSSGSSGPQPSPIARERGKSRYRERGEDGEKVPSKNRLNRPNLFNILTPQGDSSGRFPPQNWLTGVQPVAVDIETNGAFHHGGYLEVRSVQFSDGESTYVLRGSDIDLAAEILKRGRIIVWRGSYDMSILCRQFGIDPIDVDFIDLAETSKTVAPSMSLKELARAELGAEWGDPEVALMEMFEENGWSSRPKMGAKPADVDAWAASGKSGWAEVDAEDPVFQTYAATDAVVTYRLFERLHGGVLTAASLREAKVAKVMTVATTRGIAVDVDRLRAERNHTEATAIELKTRFQFNHGVNPYSDSQVRPMLDDIVDLGMLPKTDGGDPSLKAEHLEPFTGDPVIDELLVVRDAKKAKTKPGEILAYVTLEGRVHPEIATQAAHTFRMTSSKPAMQNLAKSMRSVFVPDEGHQFVSVDLNQIELRVAAAISGDERMIQAFADGVDIHQQTADAVDITRAEAKGLNFGVIYGMGVAGISRRLRVSSEEAEAVLARYRDAYPQLETWRRDTFSRARNSESVVTPFGRTIAVAQPYLGVNYVVQSSARDVFAEGIARLHDDELVRHFVLPVHDEVLLAAPDDDVVDVATKVQGSLVGGGEWDPGTPGSVAVPITAEVSQPGESWAAVYDQ